MEPRRKRPRLSMFAANDDGADTDLETARTQNDISLKSRFEKIFEKYSHNFEGIGDEIDLVTGKIVVNNGHLQTIVTETDTGKTDGQYGGRSLLSVMTLASEEDDPYLDHEGADEVMMSIETMAENAAMVIELSDDGSEDELFAQEEEGEEEQIHIKDEFSNESPDHISESDSLFVQDSRQSSPDSLFEAVVPSKRPLPNPDESVHDAAVLAKFGTRVGKQVLDLIERRKQAEIEPAWRVPVEIRPQRLSSSRSRSMSSFSLVTPVPETTDGYRRSIWKAPRQRATTKKHHNQIRDDSVDPLQEGFISDEDVRAGMYTEDHLDNPDDGDYEDDQSRYSEEVDEIVNDSIERPESYNKVRDSLDSETCQFCQKTFTSTKGIQGHWRRLIRKHEQGYDDGIHDIEMIASTNTFQFRPDRGPRLLMDDLRTMIELHEGVGLSFDQIADSQALITQNKTAAQLQDLYDRNRSAGDEDAEPYEWSFEELDKLRSLCEQPHITMATVAKKLKKDSFDIGDKMAEIWLAELKAKEMSSVERSVSLADEGRPDSISCSPPRQSPPPPRLHLVKPVRNSTGLYVPPPPPELILPLKHVNSSFHLPSQLYRSVAGPVHPLAIAPQIEIPPATPLQQPQPVQPIKPSSQPNRAKHRTPQHRTAQIKTEDSDSELFGTGG